MSDLTEFLQRFGITPAAVLQVGAAVTDWPTIVVEFANKQAILQFCGVADQATGSTHLSIDIHAFVEETTARAGVFGMEAGRRYDAFGEQAPGRSHGWPAVRGVSVLIGNQEE